MATASRDTPVWGWRELSPRQCVCIRLSPFVAAYTIYLPADCCNNICQNASFVIANSSFVIANSSFVIANSSFVIANSSAVIAKSFFVIANSCFVITHSLLPITNCFFVIALLLQMHLFLAQIAALLMFASPALPALHAGYPT